LGDSFWWDKYVDRIWWSLKRIGIIWEFGIMMSQTHVEECRVYANFEPPWQGKCPVKMWSAQRSRWLPLQKRNSRDPWPSNTWE
jgi:hypothetical protein